MSPIEYRRRAVQFERENPDISICGAFLQGCLYAQSHPLPDSQPCSDVNNQPCSADVLPPCSAEDLSFESFWKAYDYKKAKPQALKMWKRLSKAQQREVMQALPAYIESTPDKSYRMHPATFLNPANERWRDEITIQTPNNYDKQQQRLASYAEAIAAVGAESY